MNTGQIIFGTEVTGTNGFKIVKVIEPVYQILYEIAQQHGSAEMKQVRIYAKLIEWVDEHYPGWGIQNFVDLSADEARKINNQRIDDVLTGPLDLMHRNQLMLSWGMYLLLQQGVPHTKRQTQTDKQIEDNDPTKLLE